MPRPSAYLVNYDEEARDRAERDARPLRDKALAAIETRCVEALRAWIGVSAHSIVRTRGSIRAQAGAEANLAWELYETHIEETLRDGEPSEATYARWDLLMTGERAVEEVA